MTAINSARTESSPDQQQLLPARLTVRGARAHNLRGVDLDLPHRSLVVFTGVSGSGKSSLAFDTIYAEGQRRQVQSMSTFARQFMDEMDKPDVDRIDGLCSAVAVDQRSSTSRSPRSTVGTVTEVYDLMRVVFAQVGQPHCTVCGQELLDDDGVLQCVEGHDTARPEMFSRSFSFNLPFGRCPDCAGLGDRLEVDPALVVPDPARTLAEGAIAPWRVTRERTTKATRSDAERALAAALLADQGHGTDVPWHELPDHLRQDLLYGNEIPVQDKVFTGVVPWLYTQHKKAYIEGGQAVLEAFMRQVVCPSCGGGRLTPAQLGVRVGGMNIAEASALPVAGCLRLFEQLDLSERDRTVIAQAVEEITERLRYLTEVGLGYLTLDRPARTLSGGEAQRIRLASQLGTKLFGLLYVLDEPTAGLHPKDTEELIATLRALRDQGNTLIVVEHDHHMIAAGDWVVEMGPGAGELGGQLMFTGTVPDLMADADSLTGGYLSGRRGAALPPSRRRPAPRRELTVRGARAHNLTGFDVAFPLGCFIAQPGVGAVGVLLGLGLVTPLVRGDHVAAGRVVAVVALVAQGDQSGVAQRGEDVPD